VTTSVSDRETDAFDNSAKSAYRQRHLDVLREQVPELWVDEERPRLRGSWLELMGATGWRTLELLVQADAVSHEQFIGVDLDADRIAAYQARYPRARWLPGDLLDLVNRPELRDVSVIHYDAYDAVATGRLDHVSEQLATVLARSLSSYGAAMLIWNADLDASRLRGQAPASALRNHAIAVASLLRGIGGDRRELDATSFLPANAELAVAEPGFTGYVGAIDVYRGKNVGHRMACLRIVLR